MATWSLPALSWSVVPSPGTLAWYTSWLPGHCPPCPGAWCRHLEPSPGTRHGYLVIARTVLERGAVTWNPRLVHVMATWSLPALSWSVVPSPGTLAWYTSWQPGHCPPCPGAWCRHLEPSPGTRHGNLVIVRPVLERCAVTWNLRLVHVMVTWSLSALSWSVVPSPATVPKAGQ